MLNVVTTSNVRRLCDKIGWSRDDFIAYMRLKAGIKEITARRIYEGETNMRVDTAVKVAAILGVSSLGDLIEIKPSKK